MFILLSRYPGQLCGPLQGKPSAVTVSMPGPVGWLPLWQLITVQRDSNPSRLQAAPKHPQRYP